MKTLALFRAGRMRSLVGLAVFLGLVMSSGWDFLLAATYVPETTPRKGEKRFTSFVYKGTHNAYLADGVTLDKQIDDYNVWQVELDIAWDTNGGNGTFDGVVVDHDCGAGTAQTLGDAFAELRNSKTLNSRFTVITMELKQKQSCRDDWPTNTVYREYIFNKIDQYLDTNRVYTSFQFKYTDNQTWPSMQELLRRGKNYCFILNEIQTGQTLSSFFFNQEFDNPPLANAAYNRVQYSLSGGSDGFVGDNVVDESQIPNKDQFIWRVYPKLPSCVDTDGTGPASYWSKNVDRGFTFVNVNCVKNEDQIVDLRTHPPQPLYVDRNLSNSKEYGTYGEPVSLMDAAILRASSGMVDILIKPGTYDLLPGFNVIAKPMTFKANGGPVTIRK